MARITLVRLILDATDRSIPPDMMTIVIPRATIARGADCLKILTKF